MWPSGQMATRSQPWRQYSEVRRNSGPRPPCSGEKRMLLAEADRCEQAATLGAFLPSKRIYSSMLSSRCKQAGSFMRKMRIVALRLA
jgi:hypothetical protein